MADIYRQTASETPPELTDLVAVYPLAGLSPGAPDNDAAAITRATNNPPVITTLQALATALSPSNATIAQAGIVELATIAQAREGLDNERAVTPAGVRAALGADTTPRTFVGLNDTPNTFGVAGQFVRINTDGDALEFVNEPTPTGAQIVTALTALTGGAQLPATAIRDLPAGNLVGLTDTPDAIGNIGQVLVVNSDRTGFRYADQSTAQSGLTSVISDTSLSGDGTSSNPLRVTERYTATERDKLAGIAAGAEVNVQADWNALSGDSLILNKPTIPTPQSATQIRNLLQGLTGAERLPSTAIRDLPTGGGGISNNLLSGTLPSDTTNYRIPSSSQSSGYTSLDNNLGIRMEDGKFYVVVLGYGSSQVDNRNTPLTRMVYMRSGNGDISFSGIGTTLHLEFRTPRTGNTALWSVSDSRSFNVRIFGIFEVGSGASTFGSSTFLGLDDTPSTFGTAGQILSVNSATNALEFIDAPSAGATETGASIVSKLTALTGNARLPATAIRDLPTGVGGGSSTFLGLTDTPQRFGVPGQILQINTAQTALEFVAPPNTITDRERSKLARIQDGATVDQSGGEIVRLLSALTGNARLPASAVSGVFTSINSDGTITGLGTTTSPLRITNPFTATDENKLNGIESNATRDQSATEIRDALVGLSGNARLPATAVRDLPTGGGGLSSVSSDSTITGTGTTASPLSVANPFTATDESKLDGIESNATRDQSGSEIVTAIAALSGNARLPATAIRDLNTTFAGLTDTPASLGTAGQIPAVNSGGTALEFIDAPSGGSAETGASIVSKLAALTGNARLSYSSLRDTPDEETGATIVSKLTGLSGNARLPATAIRDLPEGGGSDTALQIVSKLSSLTGPVRLPSSAIDNLSFLALEDTPSELGTAGQIPAVNAAGNALEFIDAPSGGGGGGGGGLGNNLLTTAVDIGAFTAGNSVSNVASLPVRLEDNKWYVVQIGPGSAISSNLRGITGLSKLMKFENTRGEIIISSAEFDGIEGEGNAGRDMGYIDFNFTNGTTGNTSVSVYTPRGTTGGTSTQLGGANRLAFYEIRELVVASSGGGGGGGSSTFTGLTDTPASLGTAGQIPAVNSGGTALEFIDAPSGGGGGGVTLGDNLLRTTVAVDNRGVGVRYPFVSGTTALVTNGLYMARITSATSERQIIFTMPSRAAEVTSDSWRFLFDTTFFRRRGTGSEALTLRGLHRIS